VGPDVGPAGAGVVVDAEHRADLVVGESGREDVRRAVAECVGDEYDRPVVDLPDAVLQRLRVEREGAGVLRAGLGRLLDRGQPRRQVLDRRDSWRWTIE
jgi:hypothetical protein